MTTESLSAVLEQEHRQIDADLASYVDAPTADGPAAVRLPQALRMLRRHIYVEEELVFPGFSGSGLMAPVMVMLREHKQMWETLDAIEPLVNGSDTDVKSAAMLCHQLAVQLQHHNTKEERILYPPADGVLTPEGRARVDAFLASGDIPEGWTCTMLRS